MLRPHAAGLGQSLAGPGPGRGRDAQSRPRLQALISGLAALRITTVVRARTTAVLSGVTGALHREVRRRPALSTAVGAAALGLVIVSVAAPGAAAPEFRSPPAAVMSAPSIPVSAAAVYTGLAPYEPPEPDDDRVSPSPSTSAVAGRSGSPAPVPTVTDDAATVLSGVRDMPAETAPAGAATRSVADPAVGSAPEVKASVAVGEPRDGESITAATPVTGIADMPDGHEVWLLSRHGSGGYRVEGACRGGHSFTCGPATLESGGDADFELTALVVDPATARGLQAGETRDGLPAHLARSQVAVRRAAA
ncbi:hypothetical protein [Actinoplanes subglobosus]|uniref:Uncharacterized protein n=1 Tax=Actinoplanes subglobosus TaxID=1547892 RepID=A0ABV8J308_9ACTN